MMQPKTTVESVKAGLAKLIREVGLLHREVAGLNTRLDKFTEKHPIPRRFRVVGLDYHQRPETPEPVSIYQEALRHLEAGEKPEIQHRLLLAILKDTDGALRDIRAAYSDINAIVNDSDLRDDFKKYLDRQ